MEMTWVPDYSPHECVPTQDAYDATVRALEKHRERADRAEAELAAIRDLAFRGAGSPADALNTIHQRASRALNEENDR
ncbi:hypothetical protein [Actinoplanes missouriensis]|uniref:hypothetical protein n=1 Tax=Actinoplanes missouriensis TaxID=1866 RepID=UPI0002E49340|nr:hypothetical protein [Actinoplanes missouriensis]